jgi:signal transduction histidine kinase/ActR/RegA family two-component response regulator
MLGSESPAAGRTEREGEIRGTDKTEHEHTFLATAPAGTRERRIALAVVLVSTLVFAAVIPFVRVPLPKMPAFIPSYESALAINDLITAVLLFGKFTGLRSRALLVLGSGFLFNALIIIPHALTFPDAFSPAGLLGAGDQTTAWLYVFWHAGFPLFVLAYAVLRSTPDTDALRGSPALALSTAIVLVVALVCALTLLATTGMDLLPVLIRGGNFMLLITTGVSPAIWALSLVALVALWRRRDSSVLDLWLMVVMWAWLLDVALSAIISSSRYDLGWYAGRTYGLLAASFVLGVLLVETNRLHDRLAAAKDMLAGRALDLQQKVSERTEQLQRSEEQLRQAQKMETLGQLTGGLAHDFNNLLAVAIGNLDLLIRSWKGDPLEQEMVQEALDAALSGRELTRRLLAFARRQPLLPEKIDANELIGGISKLLARTLGERIRIRLRLDSEASPIVADRIQLETAIANLANNARDAMPNGGELVIASRNASLDEAYAASHSEVAAGDYVLIEITDTGHGMPLEVQERIFEPFYTTKGLGKGTGLGLSMVFGFMKQSGGHISVYSEPGRGTTFRLYLPPADGRPVEELMDVPAVLQQYKGSGTVLVVEDNAKIRAVVARQLNGMGFNVIEANTAERALAELERGESIDLLFTDIVLPGAMDGCALARKAMSRDRPPRVLLTSGFPGASFGAVAELGADVRLLSKPYRQDELVGVLREIMHGRHSRAVA